MVNNKWVNAESGKTFSVFNPATGGKIIDVQEGDKVRYLAPTYCRILYSLQY